MDKILNKITYLVLFLFLCATVAHQTWVGFDALFCKATFMLYLFLIGIKILINKKIIINEYVKWFCIFFLYLACSCFWANNINDATVYFSNYFLRIFVLIIGLSNTIKDKEDIDKILKIYIYSIIYMIIVLVIKTPTRDWGTYRIGQTIGLWKNSIGLYLAYAALFSIYFHTTEKSKIKKVIWNLISILMIFLTIISGCRKALLMIPAGIIIYIFLKQKKQLSIKKLLKIMGAIVIIPVILYISFKFIIKNDFLYNAIGERVESGINVLFNDGEEQSLGEREFYIKEATMLFVNNPILGYGSNGFVTHMREISYSHIAYCHNNFLEILSTLGIIGFIIYYYMQIKLIYMLFKHRMLNKNLYCIEITVLVLIAIFGWWNVYYFELINNFIFIISFLSITNKENIGIIIKE